MFAWQATVQDEAGNIVPLPVVHVYESDGVTLASIYTEGGASLPNPLTGTLEGFVQFWAEAGEYKVRGSYSGQNTAYWSIFLDTPLTDAIARVDDLVLVVQGLADDASDSNAQAAISATNAGASATLAAGRASAAAAYRDEARDSASASSVSATQSASSASLSAAYRNQSQGFAGSSNQSATEAAGSAVDASNHKDEAEDFAIAAGDSATQASASAVDAGVYRDQAASYAVSAGTSANFYDTIALGRAAVADGVTFGVIAGGSDGLTRPTLYRRNSATTQTEIVGMASGIEVDAKADSIERGTVPSGLDIGSITIPGTYLLAGGSTYTGVPPDFNAALSYWLIVDAYGRFSNNTGRFALQRLVSMSITDPTGAYRRRVTWSRRLDKQSPSTAGQWVLETPASGAEVEVFTKRGQVPSGTNINTLNLIGEYQLLTSSSYIGVPPDSNPAHSHRLIISNAGTGSTGSGQNRFSGVYVESMSITDFGTASARRRAWYRRRDNNSPDSFVGENSWVEVTPSQSGTSGEGPISGDTVVVIGDSITEGSSTFKWPPLLANRTGATVVNGGFGGCRMAVHDQASVGYLYDPMCGYRLAERIAAGDWGVLTAAAEALFLAEGDDNRPQAAALAATNWSQVDWLVVTFGTNDFRGTGGMGVPIGNDNDMTGATFKGAINLICRDVLSSYPNIRLVFATPLWRSRVDVSGDDSNVTPNGSGVYLREYADAIKERAEWHQVPVIDLLNKSGINIYNWSTIMPDGLHPYSGVGMQRVADVISGGMESLA